MSKSLTDGTISLEKLAPKDFHSLKLGVKLTYQGKKVILNPLDPVTISYHVSDHLLTGHWKRGTLTGTFADWQAIFPGWVLHDFVLYRVDAPEWVAYAYPGPRTLTPLELATLRAEEDLPPTRWEVAETPIWPFLRLTDRSGAFADLWFDYPGRVVAAHDPLVANWRQKEVERGWEKDLLETSFHPKQVGSSHYYCPLDKVTKSLMFLLECGWKILDYQGRRVYRPGTLTLELLPRSTDQIDLSGTVAYDTFTANVQDVVGAFSRRESFLSLSSDAVGLVLIDPEIGSEGFTLKRHHVAHLEELMKRPDVTLKAPLPFVATAALDPAESFQATLYPYQLTGMQWISSLYARGLCALLADEMGLGKRVQTLAFLSTLPKESKILIITPTSLLFNWKREIQSLFPELSYTLISYAQLRLNLEEYADETYTCIVLDEGQTIKNPQSQIARAVCTLKSHFRLVLTGTPIENRIEDLWSIFTFLLPEAAPFTQKKVAPFILRRRKEEVAPELPPKLYQTIWVEMEAPQRSLYEEYIRKFKSDRSVHRMEILESILRLRQLCCHPLLVGGESSSAKLERLIEDLEIIHAEGKKALIFSQFTQMLSLIKRELEARSWRYVYLDGSTTDRKTPVDQFQNDPTLPFFLISLKAGGVGLNLTAADYALIYDPWWNQAAEEQAIDRAHRFGRSGTLIARRYAVAESIEEKLMRLKESKLALSEELFGLSIEELQSLI